jgi:hypothetical protein
MHSPTLTLDVLPDQFAICRLDSAAPVPDWALSGSFYSVTQTSDELSVVCCQRNVPPHVQCNRDWLCVRVAGPLDFTLTGILAALAAPLAQAGISIFALSTYDTDYLLVKQADLQDALEVLTKAGHCVQD